MGRNAGQNGPLDLRKVEVNERIECFLIVKRSEVKTSMKGAAYLDMMLGNKTGEINAKFWDYQTGVTPDFPVNTIVKVRGQVNEYRGARQLRLERIRLTVPTDNVDPADYVASADYSPEDMYNEVIRMTDGFRDDDLKQLLLAVYSKYKEPLLYYPAAIRLHHAYRGGLLYHTLSILRMCQKTAEVYPLVDRDLLLTGAALHDIGKLSEMDATELGIAAQYTVDGNLIGHLVRGAMMVHDVGLSIGTPSDKLELVEHMLISHHGKPEYGAAMPPKFLEASVLAKLDELDATVYEISDTLSSVEPGAFSPRIWALDDVRLYNHGRTPISPKANLMGSEDSDDMEQSGSDNGSSHE